jgi:ABC-type antimicrobial peptide transport system permease subunit
MLLSGAFVLALASGIACAVPAWRASRIDPMMALWCE